MTNKWSDLGHDVRQAVEELPSVEGSWCSVTVPYDDEGHIVIAVSRKQVNEWDVFHERDELRAEIERLRAALAVLADLALRHGWETAANDHVREAINLAQHKGS